MKRSAHRLLVVFAIVFSIAVGLWAFSYHTFEFKGGVNIRDSGFLSYPRYYVQLGDLPLWKDGEYQFTVRGLPSDELDLRLEVLDASNDDKARLIDSSTFLSVSITDRSAKEVCVASGSLQSYWVLAPAKDTVSFWHPRCQHMSISRFKTYTTKVTVSRADVHSPHRMLMAVFKGGGNELP